MMFSNLRLSTRMAAQGVVIVLCFVLVLAWLYPTMRRNLYDMKYRKTKQLVEVAHGVVDGYVRQAENGTLPVEKAKEQAREALRTLRYGNDDYFWINDLEPRMVMHPNMTELEGKSLADFKDPQGKKLFVAFVEACKAEGGGFVDYMWPKPGESTPVPKISYVKLTPEWGWIIGSGIYIEDIRAEMARVLYVSMYGSLAILLACLGISYWMGAPITKAFQHVVDTTKVIAEGDLRSRVPVEGPPELRALAQGVNTMADNLSAILGRIQDTSAQLATLSARVMDATRTDSADADRQAASISQITDSVEELSATSRGIAGNAESVKAAALKTVRVAQDGTVLVRDSVDAIGMLRERVSEIANQGSFLGEKSHEVGKVMDIIQEIAAETHLLALNAAIESAAAGEQGRRFAVVASEVRRLAEKTKESTEEIQSIISEIRSAIGSSIRTTELGSHDAARSAESIDRSAGAFESIIRNIEMTTEASARISEATMQQTVSNDQVARTIREVSASIATLAGHMQISMNAVAEMSEVIDRLNEATKKFQT
jgi:methyl-accepting chemotaxis protein